MLIGVVDAMENHTSFPDVMTGDIVFIAVTGYKIKSQQSSIRLSV